MAVASNDDGKTASAAGSASRPLVLLVKNELLWRSQVAEALRSRSSATRNRDLQQVDADADALLVSS